MSYILYHFQNVLLMTRIFFLPGGNSKETQDDYNGVCPAGERTPLHCRRLSLWITDEPRHWNPVTVSTSHATIRHCDPMAIQLLTPFTHVLLVQPVDVRVGLNALTGSRANVIYLARYVLTLAPGKIIVGAAEKATCLYNVNHIKIMHASWTARGGKKIHCTP